VILTKSSLNPALADLDAMNFLNEITLRFPEAISFAPGRPFEPLFHAESSLRAIRSFATNRSSSPVGETLDRLMQYGRAKGIICDLVAEMLRRDEHIDVSDDAIVITVGNQEATFVALSTLFGARREDVLLVANPSYVGVSGAARILGIETWPVPGGKAGLDLAAVERLCKVASADGRRVRALYVIPDFSNPQGTTMAMVAREALLQLAIDEDFLILEDNAYGMFAYETARLPTLKALDRTQQVIYVGSFSKLIYPGVRVGFAVADQRVDRATLLADEMGKVKSMTTVNTSPVAQAIVGGLLLEHGCTLAAATTAKVEHCRCNRDQLVRSLREAFSSNDGVTWNEPKGGFFLTLDVPFFADDALLSESATADGVLWVPMRYFFLGGGGERQMRLSFSGMTAEDIKIGVERLAGLVRRKCNMSAVTVMQSLRG
jgi:(S)-3,5-dihydroxyphenylglycine transaminase